MSTNVDYIVEDIKDLTFAERAELGVRLGFPTQQKKQAAASPVLMTRNSPTNQRVADLIAEINASPGSNAYAKANALLCARVTGHKELPWSEQCRRAGEFTRAVMQGEIPSEYAAAAVPGATPPATAAADTLVKVVAAVNASQGPNAYAKANAYLCARSAEHRAKPLAEQCRIAGEFTRALMRGELPKVG
jgi:hypothetical protein